VIPVFILDASVALAWCFRDEETPATKLLLMQMSQHGALVPALWFVEMTNVLAIGERKGRITVPELEAFVSLIDGFDLEIDAGTRAFTALLPLCRAHQLTSYDAVYLELALRRRLPLATLDEPLRKAARKLDVKLLGQ
jgi:predicted nucleic acid-binding protein